MNVSQPELHSECWISLRSREILSPKPNTGALVLLSVAGETAPNKTWGKKDSFPFTLPGHNQSSREVRAGTEAGTWSTAYCLAPFSSCSASQLIHMHVYAHTNTQTNVI